MTKKILNGPSHKVIPMDPEEREKLLATGDYDFPAQAQFQNAYSEEIETLKLQVLELARAHNNLKAHYHEFVKATIQAFKENAEEE